jgi:hypothetical protein
MAQKLTRKKTNKKAKKMRQNPKKRWWHSWPVIGRVFKGVQIGESQIPVEDGTLIIQSENTPLVGEVISGLSSILANKKVKIMYAPTGGKPKSLNIELPKSEEGGEPDFSELAMARAMRYR